jgi:2-desacetyl-2-hydroxyethyl bacteriochlorophyllide A dehydrogenase
MRALVCESPGKLRLGARPQPSPGVGEVLVRIRRAGVCGTDFHIFAGSHPYLAYPRVIGHELAGEIAAVGPGCTIDVGRQVYVIPYLACGACVACRRGKTNCCAKLQVLGVHVDGGMADYICVPEANVAKADGLTLDQAAMVEFLAIGAHAVRRANPAQGDRALVVGAGPIGMGCMIFAKARGASVTALDMRDDRLIFCREQLGVAHAIVAGAHARDAMSSLTGGDFFDIVIDATGSAKSMAASLEYVAHGGAYVLVGVVNETIGFSDPEFHKRETNLLGSRNATPEDFARVVAEIRAGGVPTAALANHRATLDEAPERFPVWINPETGVIKAILEI